MCVRLVGFDLLLDNVLSVKVRVLNEVHVGADGLVRLLERGIKGKERLLLLGQEPLGVALLFLEVLERLGRRLDLKKIKV